MVCVFWGVGAGGVRVFGVCLGGCVLGVFGLLYVCHL